MKENGVYGSRLRINISIKDQSLHAYFTWVTGTEGVFSK